MLAASNYKNTSRGARTCRGTMFIVFRVFFLKRIDQGFFFVFVLNDIVYAICLKKRTGKLNSKESNVWLQIQVSHNLRNEKKKTGLLQDFHDTATP